jgi:hypothetical protein
MISLAPFSSMDCITLEHNVAKVTLMEIRLAAVKVSHRIVDVHVDGMTLRLPTVATTGPVVHPPDDGEVWRATVERCGHGKTLEH